MIASCHWRAFAWHGTLAERREVGGRAAASLNHSAGKLYSSSSSINVVTLSSKATGAAWESLPSRALILSFNRSRLAS